MKRLLHIVVSTMLVLQPVIVNAGSPQIVVDTGTRPGAPAPSLEVQPNGTPLINIATPNGAGLSHNQFTKYNVGPTQLILNNATGAVTSQLGGVVYANPNLHGTSAGVILNEVTGSTPSTLAGVTEVAGHGAEVIVANPNGIVCAGCGFINVTRGTLTTGTPNIGADGSLQNLNVKNGTIDFEGQGGDFSNVPIMDIISRRVLLNAPVTGQTIGITAGQTSYNYAKPARRPQRRTVQPLRPLRSTVPRLAACMPGAFRSM
jgi:filamentous hemagglutinin